MTLRVRTRHVVFVAVLGLFFCVPGASAQETRRLLVQPTPMYPPMAKNLRLTGTVKVQVIVSPSGQITDTKVLGGHPLLVEATMETLKKWKYAPAANQTTAQLEFNFHP